MADQFFKLLGVTVREEERDDTVAELGRGADGEQVDGILLLPAIEWLSAMEHPRLSDQMIDAVFVDIDGVPPGPGARQGAARWDNLISESELSARLAALHPYFAPKAHKEDAHGGGHGGHGGHGSRGDKALKEWLEWACKKAKLQCDFVDGHGRLFTPHTFRALLKEGTQVGGSH